MSAPVAPPVTDVEIKLPAGIELRKQFQTGSTVCSEARLVANLSCNGAKIGQGEVKLDFQPFTSQTVPADVSVYLGPGDPGQRRLVADEGGPPHRVRQGVRVRRRQRDRRQRQAGDLGADLS